MPQPRRWLVTVGLAALAILSAVLIFAPHPNLKPAAATNSVRQMAGRGASASQVQRVMQTVARLPISFEERSGGGNTSERFISSGPGYKLEISGKGASLTHTYQRKADEGNPIAAILGVPVKARSEMQLTWLGANEETRVTGQQKQRGESNYLPSADRKTWRQHVAHYGGVKVANLYPGVDVKFHGDGQRLEFDYLIAPGADAAAVRLGIGTPSIVNINGNGELEISDEGDQLVLQKPVAYQEIDGERKPVKAEYLLAERHEVRFALGEYDKKHALIIDPVLSFASQFGASSNLNIASDVSVDATGNIYLTGTSCDVDYPVTAGALQSSGGSVGNALCYTGIITKLDATASSIIYSTYIGSQNNLTSGIRILPVSGGGALVAGLTTATDFPTTAGAFETSAHGGTCAYGPNLLNKPCTDGFLLQLSNDGSSLVFSTLFGGNSSEIVSAMTVDPTGNVFVAGATSSPDFPTTSGTIDTAFGGGSCQSGLFACADAFVVKFSSDGSKLLESTFLGGSDDDFASGVALDSTGNIYVAGGTNSVDFPVSNGAFQTVHSAGANQPDGFVVKLTPDMKTLTYGTYLGGTGFDLVLALKVDSTGAAYVTGSTGSTDFPTTAGSFQTSYAGPATPFCDATIDTSDFSQPTCGDIFISKLNPAGSALVFSTYLGGSAPDIAFNLGLDSSKNVWIMADTASSDFPYTADAYHSSSGQNVALVELSADGKSVLFATPLSEGTAGQALALGLTIDSADDVYVAGQATIFSPTPGTFTSGSNPSLFVAKFVTGTARPGLQLSTTTVSFSNSTVPEGSTSAPQSVTLTNNGTATLQLAISVPVSSSNPFSIAETDNCGTSVTAGASCTINVVYQPTATGNNGGVIRIVDNAPGSPHSIQVTGSTGTIDAATFFPSTLTFQGQGPGTTSASQTSGVDTPASQPGAIEPIPTGPPVISGPNVADFIIDATQCTAAAHGCGITASFSPAANATGTRTATVSVPTNAPNSPQVLTLTGTVSAGPFGFFSGGMGVRVIPTMLGETSNNTFFVGNSGGAALVATGIAISGANAADFTVIPEGCNTAFTVQPGQLCSFELAFKPAAHGTRTATLTVTDNETTPATTTVTAYGQDATGPALSYSVSPSTNNVNVPFQGTVVGTTGLFTAFVSITNATGTASAQVTPSITTGAGDFIINSSNNSCTATIAAGSGCMFTVSFSPTAAGPRTGTLTIATNAPGGQTFTVNLSGTGLLEPQATVTPAVLTFPQQNVGSTSATGQTVTAKNPGNGVLNLSAPAISGPFTQTTTCGATLLAGASCMFTVKFAPTKAGPATGLLSFTSNAAGGTFGVGLNGLGVSGPSALLTPASVTFGNQPIGTTSAAQSVVLSNAGDASFTFSGLQAVENFTATSNCPGTLAAGGSCTISVKFAPTPDTFEGAATSGAVYITTSAPNSPLTLLVNGTATTPTGATNNQALASSLNPSVVGQAVTFTDTVTAAAPSGPTPTGTVMFIDGEAQIGGVAVLNSKGVASVTVSTLSVGVHSIFCMYTGDATYAPTTSSGIGQTVIAPTSTTVASSQNPASVGQTVMFTASVTSTFPGTIAGSFSFFDGATSISDPISVSGGKGVLSISTLAAGTHSITARYNGGGPTYATSTSPAISQVVNSAGAAATTITLKSSLNPSTSGASVTFTATVSSTTSGTISGNVTFFDGATQLGSAMALSGGMASLSSSALSKGTHSVTAKYGGDATFAASTSTAVSQVVNAAALAATTTALASSANPSTVGANVTFTATATSTTAGTLTGTVSFFDGATQLGAPVAISGGMATLSTTALTQGTHSITAKYSGDGTFATSTSSAVSQVVNAEALATTTTAVTSSLNPSTVGQGITFTATATSKTAGTLTGTISFFDGATQLGSAVAISGGMATLSTTALTQGTHSITAKYSGDGTFATSTSSAVSQVVNAAPLAATTTAVTSSLNPSPVGQSVTFTATATSKTAGTLTGTLSFFDGATQLGSAVAISGGMATFSTSALTAGPHSITAKYSGDGTFATSTSAALTQNVNAAGKAATLVALTSSANPSTAGASVTFTGTVTSATAGTITGTVTFFDGATSLGPGTVGAAGAATFTTSSLTGGSHSITAQYGGDTNFAASTSAIFTQTVNATQDYSLSASPSMVTVTAGQTASSAITVTPLHGSTQTVSFACSNLPAAATCAFAPPSVTLDGTHAGTSQVMITTTARNSVASMTGWVGQPSRPTPLSILVLFVCAGILGLLLTRTRELSWRVALPLVLIVISVGFVAACGNSRKVTTGTPIGTTQVNVTAVAGTDSHSVSITVTVQ
jgi:hypothetical protein